MIKVCGLAWDIQNESEGGGKFPASQFATQTVGLIQLESALVQTSLTSRRGTWRRTHAPPIIGNTITALNFSTTGQCNRVFVGDSLGWLYTYSSSTREQDGETYAPGPGRWNGEYQMNLHPGGEVREPRQHLTALFLTLTPSGVVNSCKRNAMCSYMFRTFDSDLCSEI